MKRQKKFWFLGAAAVVAVAVAAGFVAYGGSRPAINGNVQPNVSDGQEHVHPGELVDLFVGVQGPKGTTVERVVKLIPLGHLPLPTLRHVGVAVFPLTGGVEDGWPANEVGPLTGAPAYPRPAMIALSVSASSKGLYGLDGAVVVVKYHGTSYTVKATTPSEIGLEENVPGQ